MQSGQDTLLLEEKVFTLTSLFIFKAPTLKFLGSRAEYSSAAVFQSFFSVEMMTYSPEQIC